MKPHSAKWIDKTPERMKSGCPWCGARCDEPCTDTRPGKPSEPLRFKIHGARGWSAIGEPEPIGEGWDNPK